MWAGPSPGVAQGESGPGLPDVGDCGQLFWDRGPADPSDSPEKFTGRGLRAAGFLGAAGPRPGALVRKITDLSPGGQADPGRGRDWAGAAGGRRAAGAEFLTAVPTGPGPRPIRLWTRPAAAVRPRCDQHLFHAAAGPAKGASRKVPGVSGLGGGPAARSPVDQAGAAAAGDRAVQLLAGHVSAGRTTWAGCGWPTAATFSLVGASTRVRMATWFAPGSQQSDAFSLVSGGQPAYARDLAQPSHQPPVAVPLVGARWWIHGVRRRHGPDQGERPSLGGWPDRPATFPRGGLAEPERPLGKVRPTRVWAEPFPGGCWLGRGADQKDGVRGPGSPDLSDDHHRPRPARRSERFWRAVEWLVRRAAGVAAVRRSRRAVSHRPVGRWRSAGQKEGAVPSGPDALASHPAARWGGASALRWAGHPLMSAGPFSLGWLVEPSSR
ncbi:hypothetical protein JJ691_77680 [Kutzneria sp. CA-103260]|nr:hypothetical protein JJ691_77680 [Kutzneria sp. CA-103260]